MNRRVHQEQPPELPMQLRGATVADVVRWIRESLYPYLTRSSGTIIEQINSQVQGVAPKITAVGSTIKIGGGPIQPMDGAAVIDTILAPQLQVGLKADHVTPRYQTDFTGPIFFLPTLVPLATWSFTTGGNIMHAATPVPGRVLIVVFDGTNWWPQ